MSMGYDGGAVIDFLDSLMNSRPTLAAHKPVALAAVDCEGSEASLMDCESSDFAIRSCEPDTNGTHTTTLACGNTSEGAAATILSACPPFNKASPPWGLPTCLTEYGDKTTCWDVPAECDEVAEDKELEIRLTGGFGSRCDSIHTGFVEIYHLGSWGSICAVEYMTDPSLAEVVCRQLGFPYGTIVDSWAPTKLQEGHNDYAFYDYNTKVEESEEPGLPMWLSALVCKGSEATVAECDLGTGFTEHRRPLDCRPATRLAVACRSFAMVEAQEAVSEPPAGACAPSWQCHNCSHVQVT
jgi:hypothetical protein